MSSRFTTGVIRVEPDRHHVTLPRIGRIRTHESTRKLARRLEQGTARILSATISHAGGRWWVSFNCHVQRAHRAARHPDAVVGVDVGIRHLAVLSTGETIPNPQPLQSAKARRDRLHKLTTRLAAGYGTVVVEDLNVAGMLRNRPLARKIADCQACGLVLDRDLNAARNLARIVKLVAGSGSGDPKRPWRGRKTRPGRADPGEAGSQRRADSLGEAGTAEPQGSAA